MKFRGLQRQPGLLNSTGRSRRPRWSGCSVKNIMDAQVCSSIDVPIDDKIGSQKKSSRPDDGNFLQSAHGKDLGKIDLRDEAQRPWACRMALEDRSVRKGDAQDTAGQEEHGEACRPEP
jgi:hypothetical protein